MKTVLDQATRDGLIARVETLTEASKPEWGKMNIHQMLKHCILADEMYLGKAEYKRIFLGRLIGRMALKGLLKDDEPMRRNSPTSPFFKIADTDGDIVAEKAKWIAAINQYGSYQKEEFVHWFFGAMTREQVGQLAYKHIDHHLRQFGA